MAESNPERTVSIHGNEWKWEDIQNDVLWCRLQAWTKQEWNSDNLDEWDHDHCSICWWELWAREGPDHRTGYTDGYHWLCEECYQQFIAMESGAERETDVDHD